MRFFEAIKYNYKYFGLSAAYTLIIRPRLCFHLGLSAYSYIDALLNWQRKEFSSIINQYKKIPVLSCELPENFPIWTCWWQGEDKMPDVIKNCHLSLQKNAGSHPIHLITKDNFSKYINIPNFLLEKLESQTISHSHFSDIIRLLLLKQYGGVWIDSALFLVRPYNHGTSFYMPKMKERDSSICQGRWWFGVFQAPQEHFLVRFILDCLLHYWKKFNAPIDYLMFDGILRIATEEFEEIGDLIDSLQVSSPDLHSSRYTFSKAVDIHLMEELIEDNDFLSLTWRINYPLKDENNNQTFYGALLEMLH